MELMKWKWSVTYFKKTVLWLATTS
jgi:hypothetical protein